MPSQIRWDKHVMNPSLSLSLECKCGARQLHFIKRMKKKNDICNQLGNEWECMFHMFSRNALPKLKIYNIVSKQGNYAGVTVFITLDSSHSCRPAQMVKGRKRCEVFEGNLNLNRQNAYFSS